MYHAGTESFLWAPVETDSDKTDSSKLSWLGQKKQEWWEEAVNSIVLSGFQPQGVEHPQ